MECIKCGFANPEQARFCAGCGVGITAIQCEHCQADNDPGNRFCVHCGLSLVQASEAKNKPKTNVERRMLTVLFCDLVDSTALVASQDPEASRGFIREYQSVAKEVIENFGGRITEYLGDGIVAQFTRHETNAERAINAALQIIKLLSQKELTIGEMRQKAVVRCGIATGMAVVGDMLGDEEIRSSSAIGLPLNLAARIQSLAQENQVVIGKTTHQLARGLFKFESLGSHRLKGISDEQPVWRVVAKQSISSRFVAHAAEMTPMVDREEVMDHLLSHWDQCKTGDAEAIVFWGEAGIGKSRIVQEFIKKVAADCAFVEYQCSPYHTHTALYPLISGVEAAAKFKPGDSIEVRLRKLERLVRWSSNDFEHDMPALVNLLSLSTEDRWPTPNLDPDEIKEWIFKAAINNLISLSSRRPLLIQLEDAHWIDPTTQALIERLVKELVGHPVLLLITSRPGYENYFSQYPHVSTLKVKRLPKNYMKQLVNQIKGDSKFLDPVIDEMVERTDGIPLFMEELSKSLLETSTSDSSESSTLALKDIPATLHDSLLSRLDHLPDESRSIALLASVIGRDFAFDLLEKIADVGDKNLYELLSPLLEAQLVMQTKAPPNAAFSFKHAMVRDVAYETLLQSDRVDIHRKIGQSLEQHYPEVIRRSPGLIARHFSEAKQYEKAVQYWILAGKKASQNSANIEARTHLDHGLAALKNVKNKAQANYYELEILLALGPIYMSTYGTGAKETHNIYLQALELSKHDANPSLRFVALWNRWRMSVNDGFSKAVKWADELLNLAEKTRDIGQLLQAHHCQWGTHYNLGDQRACFKHIKAGIKLYDEQEHRHHASTYGGHDPKVCGHSQAVLSLWLQGDYQEAEAQIHKAQTWADHLNHLGTHLHQIDVLLIYSRFTNQPEKVLEQVRKLEHLIDLDEYQDYRSKVKIYTGWAAGIQQNSEAALNLLAQGIKEHAASGTWEDKPVFLEMSAEIKSNFGQYDSALSDIEDALESANRSGVIYWNAELQRRKAEILLMKKESNFVDDAKNCYLSAIDIAKQQQVKTLELRAVTGLAKIYLSQGGKAKAGDIVNSALADFLPGFVTNDIQEAQALVKSVFDS